MLITGVNRVVSKVCSLSLNAIRVSFSDLPRTLLPVSHLEVMLRFHLNIYAQRDPTPGRPSFPLAWLGTLTVKLILSQFLSVFSSAGLQLSTCSREVLLRWNMSRDLPN